MNREPIYAALYERLIHGVEGLVTTSRRPRPASEVQPEEQPALFLEQGTSTAAGNVGMPSRHTIHVNVGIYAYAESPEGPMPLLNDLVSQAEDALKAQPGEASRTPGATTLGGLAASVRATEVKFNGDKLGAQGMAVLDIEITVAG